MANSGVRLPTPKIVNCLIYPIHYRSLLFQGLDASSKVLHELHHVTWWTRLGSSDPINILALDQMNEQPRLSAPREKHWPNILESHLDNYIPS